MASLIEMIVDEVHAQMGAPVVPYSVGRLSADAMAEQYRVVWVPGPIKTDPVKYTGPVKGLDGVLRTPLYTEKWRIECHISTVSFEAAELLRARIFVAVHSVLGASSEPRGSVYITQEDPSVAYGGTEKVVMAFEWDLMIFPPEQLAAMTKIRRIETTARPTPDSDETETIVITPL